MGIKMIYRNIATIRCTVAFTFNIAYDLILCSSVVHIAVPMRKETPNGAKTLRKARLTYIGTGNTFQS